MVISSPIQPHLLAHRVDAPVSEVQSHLVCIAPAAKLPGELNEASKLAEEHAVIPDPGQLFSQQLF